MPQEEYEQMILPFPPQYVVKSNALCRARWSAESILEPRLVALLASKIEPDDEDFKKYDIHVSELVGKEYGGDNIRQVEEAVRKTMSRVVTIYDKKGWSMYNVFSSCRFDSSTGMLTLGFHPDLIPHYIHLKQSFAKYNLLEFMMLPSVYSQRVFELLKSWKDQPQFVIPITELHEMLSTPKSYRKNFKEFRVYVLEKARKDIHKHTSLRYAWTPIKMGRRVGAIRFAFTARGFAESQLEDAKKKAGKAAANAKKNNAAWREAVACAKTKNGVCALQDRAKRVCSVCQECDMVREFADVGGQRKTQTNQ